MTNRYATVRDDNDDDDPSITAHELIEFDDIPQHTGLLDAQGRRLYRVRERIPFGFVKS